ncbi:MAG TPA: hypothetical protein VKN18_28495 [Blastocatellia bacterium]|nr:hypothetical protein [Blastocatellia bacterium]
MAVFGDPDASEFEALIERSCTICGGEAVAYWVGSGTIKVCERCALEVLPKLCADVTLRGKRLGLSRDRARVDEALDRMRIAFLEAAVTNLSRPRTSEWTGPISRST